MNRTMKTGWIALCLIILLIPPMALATSAHEHQAASVPAVQASCEQEGLTSGEVCSICGETLKAQETIPALSHQWGEWSPETGSSRHTAQCIYGCGNEKTANCSNFSITVNRTSANVCAVCGKYQSGRFETLPGAGAVPLTDAPLAQRGSLVIRGKALPFEEMDPAVLYSFTLAYEWNGGLATFKNRSSVTIPLGVELPSVFHVYRISVSPGDDSNQRKEEWILTAHDVTDNTLVFSAASPALYIIREDAISQ